MSALEAPYPEFGVSDDPKAVPWHDAVVWSSERTAEGKRVYEWLPKAEIRGISWTAGLLSIELRGESPLARDLKYILIQAPFVSVGVNVPI